MNEMNKFKAILLLVLMPVMPMHAQTAIPDSIPIDTLLLDDGTLYMGQLRDSVFEGYGRCIYPDGTVYEGSWKNGLYDGQGVLTYPDGDIYRGSFKNHIKEGTGTYYYNTGARYEGEWKDDKFNGKGKLRFEDGGLYDGIWKDDMKHGYGKLITAKGETVTGYFYNDDYLGMPFDTTIERDNTLTDELKEWGFKTETYTPEPFTSFGISYSTGGMMTNSIWLEYDKNLFWGLTFGVNISPPIKGRHSIGWKVDPNDIHLTGSYVSSLLMLDAGYSFRRLSIGGAAGLGIERFYMNCKANNISSYPQGLSITMGEPYYFIGYSGGVLVYRGYLRYALVNKYKKPKALMYLGYGNPDGLFMGFALTLSPDGN